MRQEDIKRLSEPYTGLVRALLQRTTTEETQVPALPCAAYSYDLDTPQNSFYLT
jgi:hypothetical protein